MLPLDHKCNAHTLIQMKKTNEMLGYCFYFKQCPLHNLPQFSENITECLQY